MEISIVGGSSTPSFSSSNSVDGKVNRSSPNGPQDRIIDVGDLPDGVTKQDTTARYGADDDVLELSANALAQESESRAAKQDA